MDAAGAPVLGITVLECAAAVLAIYLLKRLLRRITTNLPPGPIPLPLIGSLHLLGQRPHERLAQIAHSYGAPLISLYFGQKLCIVATSAETATEVLKHQDAVFCSRPPNRGFQVIFPNDVTFSDITPSSRRLRKLLHSQLTSTKRIEASEDIRTTEIAHMLRTIAGSPRDKPVNVKSCLEEMTANILTGMIINKRFMGQTGLDQSQEKELQEFVEITEEIGMCLGAANPRDVIPAVKYLGDLNGLDKRFKTVRTRMETFLSNIIAEHRRRHSPEKDLLDALLEEMDTIPDGEENIVTEEVVNSIVWEAFAAGMETSVLATEWTMAEVVRNPKIVKRAQLELDEVVGRSRRVQEADIPNLKYIKAIVKEAFRLHPVIPLLVPHQSNKECKVLGFDVPANTQLFVNVWAIGRDPSVWANPLDFDPERFTSEGAHAETEFVGTSFVLLPFGAGRRSCMGMALGALLVESTVANLLHCFSWSVPPEGLDMAEGIGLSVRKAVPLCAIAEPRLPPHIYAQ